MQEVSWLRDLYRDGSLEIKPPFQRKPVWTAKQRCSLIETILLTFPVPEIYIHASVDPHGTSKYAVVDGQQRVRTVLQFLGGETDPDQVEFNGFRLDKVPPDSPWRNKTFTELTDRDKRAVYGYQFAVRLLKTDDAEDVRNVFRRLNRFLSPLKPQELRNATYSGPFAVLATKLADEQYWAENHIVTTAAIRRMSDVEFMAELLIGVLHGPQAGNAAAIDDYYATYEDYEDQFPEQRKAEDLFSQSLELIKKTLPQIRDHRWGNKTDFYSLFVAVAHLLRVHPTAKPSVTKTQKALAAFGKKVDRRLGDESVSAPKNVIDYVRAVEKGANEKPRRAARHLVLVALLEPFFTKKG